MIFQSNVIPISLKEHNMNHNHSSDNLVKYLLDIPIVKTATDFGVVFDDDFVDDFLFLISYSKYGK